MLRTDGGESDDPEQAADDTTLTAFHDWSGSESLSTAVVCVVAAISGKEPTAIQPLFEVVDADALDNLFVPGTNDTPVTEGAVSFVFEGLEVTVYSSGEIVAEPSG